MTKGTPLKKDISDSGFDKHLTRPFEGLGEANREFEEQTGYSYADLVASMEGAKVQGFTTTIAFTSTDYRTVTWAAGTISYQDGLVTPEIATTNTGNMASRTYIYYDPQASKVALNITTTAATATQGERLLLAIATPNANTAGMASVEVFGATGTYIANLSVEHLTAGSIRSKTVTLAVTAGTGDCYFNAGKTDFTNTQSGFILGIDDSDSDRAKFYIGDATTYLNWNGVALSVKGAITADSGSFTGAITATSGTIGGLTIASTYLSAGTGANTCGLSPADYPFWSGATYANRATAPFKVTPAGDVTVGSLTITGGSIVGTAGDVIKMYDTVGGTQYGEIGYHTTYGVYLASIASADMYILGQGDTSLSSSGGSILIIADSGSEKVGLKGPDTGSANSSGVWLWDHDISDYVEKTAIIKTSKGFRTLYCIESPEVWFMDFCKTKDKIDPLFLEVTEKPYRFIKCEDGEYQVWGKRKGLAKKRFAEKTKNESVKNNKFWSTPLKMAR